MDEVKGGPSAYYDFPEGAITLNDVMEYLAYTRWQGDAVHLKDIMKAAFRWGGKTGTNKPYDARKIVYFGLRLLKVHGGNEAVRVYLDELINNKQFQ